MVNPKGDRTDSMLMASGAPTQHAVTNTDSGGKNGRIALHTWGRNLKAKSCPTYQKFLIYIVSKEIIFLSWCSTYSKASLQQLV